MLRKALEHNRKFVAEEGYKQFITTKYPNEKVAIITCMDTRLVELLPAAIGFKNGDVKIIKNAGGVISHPFGSVIRSLIIAIYELGVESVWVIGHTDCGMERLDVNSVLDKMKSRGISPDIIDVVKCCGVDYEAWLGGFDSANESVISTMEQIHEHPLIPKDIRIEGLIIDSMTGELTLIKSIIP